MLEGGQALGMWAVSNQGDGLFHRGSRKECSIDETLILDQGETHCTSDLQGYNKFLLF